MSKPVVLTIAGSDPTGGAGIQADLKTFAVHNVYGVSVITVLTAQNAHRFETLPIPASFITAQIEAIFEELSVQAIKIGMLANEQAVAAVIEALTRYNGERHIPVVLDPVVRASNGGVALDPGGLALLRDDLLPLTTLIKPNIPEAAILLEETPAMTVEKMQQQALALGQVGQCAVLLSGGHLAGSEAMDILSIDGKTSIFSAKKIEVADLHGTGCALTSSIAANLARGLSLYEAVEQAKNWLARLMAEKPQTDRAGQPRSMDHLSVLADKSAK